MKPLKKLFEKLFSKDRRRAERQLSPDLAAHYWTGGSPIEHKIRDISSTGLFVLTEERWYPGTLLIVTLQKKDKVEESQEHSISVQSKAVRWDTDGVGLEFVVLDTGDPRSGQSMLTGGADRQSLERFLKEFRTDNGIAIIDSILLPPELSFDTGGATY